MSGLLPFEYPPLEGPRRIRLLKVYKQTRTCLREGQPLEEPEADQDQLWCDLTTVSLDNIPSSYAAISYCWGDPRKTEKIYCSADRYIPITTSASSLLKSIAAMNTTSYIWIDALCIDQNNNDEKVKQIRLMPEIYATANRVIAWLGEPSPETAEATGVIITLHKIIREVSETGESLTEYNVRDPRDVITRSGWRAFSGFLENPYFQRAWIVQEIVFSAETDLIYGEESIKWHDLAEIVAAVSGNGLNYLVNIQEEGQLSRAPAGIRGILTIYGIRHFRRIGMERSLLWCMFECWRCQATDPRDKVFALLGLVSDGNDADFGLRYEESPQDIYKTVALNFLTKGTSGIGVLHGAGIGLSRNLPGLPSWVPDWSSPILSTVFGVVAELVQFCASGDSEMARVRYSEDSSSIKVKGRIIDTVSRTVDAMPPLIWHDGREGLQNKSRIELAWIESLRELLPPDHMYPNGDAFFPTVIARTLIANMVQPGEPAPLEYIDYFAESLAVRRVLVDVDVAAWEAESHGLTHERVIAASKYGTAVSDAMGDERRVFLTEQNLLGLGPLGMQQGDEVCIIFGLATPFVIRRREEGGYFLVGECYIDGLMNGEGLNMGIEQDIALY